MRDAGLVHRLEHARDLLAELADINDRQLAKPPVPRGQRLARQELHHQVRTSRVVTGVEDLAGAGVLDLADRDRLVEEPLDQILVLRDVRQQHLDRHACAERGVLAEIDLAHAALAEQRDDLEVTDLLSDHAASRIVPRQVRYRSASLRCSCRRWRNHPASLSSRLGNGPSSDAAGMATRGELRVNAKRCRRRCTTVPGCAG